jgi:23S rRNA (cytosine1962-C5)-methyltransferase
MVKWVLKKGEDRRLRSGHPWVFSNELLSSPKGQTPGELIEVVDQRGHFIARGYGNPHSLIAFRAVSWTEGEKEILTVGFFVNRLIRAWQMRSISGLEQSFRLCYGEADGVPGLVVDRYLIDGGIVFAVQLLTAGIQKALFPILEEVFSILIDKAVAMGLSVCDQSQMALVVRNDVNIRRLEGLEVEEPKVFLNKPGFNLNSVDIAIDTLEAGKPIWMNVNLEDGQKTGFFLDQRGNIFQLLQFLKSSKFPAIQKKRVRILDLCCYVGHWSAQLAQFLRGQGVSVDIHLLDISKDALRLAETNVKRVSGENDHIHGHLLDVMSSLETFKDAQFDIVIADPPAFIKAKKDLPTGSHAYLKLNTQAFRLCAPKGLVISCSCSGLMDLDSFRDILRKAQVRQSMINPSVIMGGHSPDHPIIMSFPEGIYLKMIGHLKL